VKQNKTKTICLNQCLFNFIGNKITINKVFQVIVYFLQPVRKKQKQNKQVKKLNVNKYCLKAVGIVFRQFYAVSELIMLTFSKLTNLLICKLINGK
jgi:hypothetical protein